MKDKLPEEFVCRMKELLKDEYEAFEESYEEPRRYGLRVNTLKVAPEELCRLAPFHFTEIPWIPGAYSYLEEDRAARHPFYAAGLYYLQEPSAMTPASVLSVSPGDKVLDLCAAPGGKATALAAKLQGGGLLVANDISASRAKALLKNLEVWGVCNSFVTTQVPVKLSERFPAYFDKILVDAPCSGEGMFRKDESVIRAWYPEKPAQCAAVQRDIVLRAADMLRAGGLLLYSTCTFAPEENEDVIRYLLAQRSNMQLVPIEDRPGFAAGFDGIGVRLWPHRTGGEGHFLALLKKAQEDRDSPKIPAKGAEAGHAGRTDAAPSREQMRYLEAFFRETGLSLPQGQLQIRNSQVYVTPAESADLSGIPFLRNGLYAGEIRKDRFTPSQSLAMAYKRPDAPAVITFSPEDERISRYLRGETVNLSSQEAKGENGWKLFCVSGFPLGWARKNGLLLKNKYHPGWRIRD